MLFINLFPKRDLDNYTLLSNWLNRILSAKLPENIVAFNFNLYEGVDETYHIHLIGSEEFDEDDEDWACTSYYSSEEDICYIKRTKDIEHWDKGLEHIERLLKQYLNDGEKAFILKDSKAIGVGFVDGNISIIYRS